MSGVLRVEFHCHTNFSRDCLLSPAHLVACCARKGIDRVVVTDHNSIGGALLAHKVDPVRVIVGEEIMTTRGELLAAFIQEEIPPGLPPGEAISRLRDQGAFVSVAHPFDAARRGSWSEADLIDVLPFVDAIEVFNSRCLRPEHNRSASLFAAARGVGRTVGSDAHTCFELGRSTLLLPPFEDASELRSVLPQAVAQTRWSPPWIHLASRYAVIRKSLRPRLDTRGGT